MSSLCTNNKIYKIRPCACVSTTFMLWTGKKSIKTHKKCNLKKHMVAVATTTQRAKYQKCMGKMMAINTTCRWLSLTYFCHIRTNMVICKIARTHIYIHAYYVQTHMNGCECEHTDKKVDLCFVACFVFGLKAKFKYPPRACNLNIFLFWMQKRGLKSYSEAFLKSRLFVRIIQILWV